MSLVRSDSAPELITLFDLVMSIIICAKVSDEKIKEVLQSTPTKDAAELLVIAALEKGGKDNVSCIVINTDSES